MPEKSIERAAPVALDPLWHTAMRLGRRIEAPFRAPGTMQDEQVECVLLSRREFDAFMLTALAGTHSGAPQPVSFDQYKAEQPSQLQPPLPLREKSVQPADERQARAIKMDSVIQAAWKHDAAALALALLSEPATAQEIADIQDPSDEEMRGLVERIRAARAAIAPTKETK